MEKTGLYLEIGQDGELKQVRFVCSYDREQQVLMGFLKRHLKKSALEKLKALFGQ
ncbi:hypothetical protein PITCH_A1400003 [uncultured Desulfobacterium sp.]|uniref:Uncharacterized protein n=1 Tax=uncultured Desulfobacterium sp. TaxID=201089 RepID=A0A445MT13_9BACT|nr:hypothetical protein PITCH_A1400003 [uncultured Desulfobacterium sp.]